MARKFGRPLEKYTPLDTNYIKYNWKPCNRWRTINVSFILEPLLRIGWTIGTNYVSPGWWSWYRRLHWTLRSSATHSIQAVRCVRSFKTLYALNLAILLIKSQSSSDNTRLLNHLDHGHPLSDMGGAGGGRVFDHTLCSQVWLSGESAGVAINVALVGIWGGDIQVNNIEDGVVAPPPPPTSTSPPHLPHWSGALGSTWTLKSGQSGSWPSPFGSSNSRTF